MKKLLLSIFIFLTLFNVGCSAFKTINHPVFPIAKEINYLNTKWEIISLYAFKDDYGQRRDVRYLFGDNSSLYPQTSDLIDLSNQVWNDIQYTPDETFRNGEHFSYDIWQSARETFLRKRGDCDDKAIFLTNILLKRNYDAYVIVGSNDGLDRINHAWVYLRLNGEEYFLDPTEFSGPLNKRYVNKFPNRKIYCIFNDKIVYKNINWKGRTYPLTKEPLYNYN